MQASDVTCTVCNLSLQRRCMDEHLKGKKHQKALEWLQRKEKARLNGIYVRGFPKDTQSNILKEFFSQYGEITEFRFDRNGEFVIVQFKAGYSAHKCLTEPLFFKGCRLIVKQRLIRDPPNRAELVTAVRGDKVNHERVTQLLTASCNEPFSVQLETLLQEIEPDEGNCMYNKICKHLEATLSQPFPGCKAHPFGSSITGLAFKGSDLDVFVNVHGGLTEGEDETSSRIINTSKKVLQKHWQLYSNVFAIPKAKTPIIKFVFSPSKTNCDLSFKNALGVNNSGLIKFYLSMDPRLRPMLMIIKYWAQKHDLSGAGRLSNYAIVMLTLCYLQQLPQAVIPSVSVLQKLCVVKTFISGWDCSYQCNIADLELGKNTMTIPELLCGFFKFYATFDYATKVICPLIGGFIPKSAFDNPQELPDEFLLYKQRVAEASENPVCLKCNTVINCQDPFEQTHNLTIGTGPRAAERWKLFCAVAVDLCTPNLTSGAPFLKDLFDENKKPKMSLEKPILIHLPFPRSGQNKSENVERCCKALLKVFKNVLKLETEVTEHISHDKRKEEVVENVSKIQKLDGQADVGIAKAEPCESQSIPKDEDECCKAREINCSGKCRIWEGRKMASKTIEYPIDASPLTKEEMLSSYIEKQQKTAANINIVCVLKPKLTKSKIFFEMYDNGCSKGDYAMVKDFMQRHLYSLVEKCLIEHKDKFT